MQRRRSWCRTQGTQLVQSQDEAKPLSATGLPKSGAAGAAVELRAPARQQPYTCCAGPLRQQPSRSRLRVVTMMDQVTSSRVGQHLDQSALAGDHQTDEALFVVLLPLLRAVLADR